MVRTQVLLTRAQHQRLKRLCRERQASLSQLVREAVDRLPEDPGTPADLAKSLLGAFEADRTDVSTRHDEYLTATERDERATSTVAAAKGGRAR